jgi:hypothetical protein
MMACSLGDTWGSRNGCMVDRVQLGNYHSDNQLLANSMDTAGNVFKDLVFVVRKHAEMDLVFMGACDDDLLQIH